MGAYSQDGRPLTVTTPLGPDALLITGLVGHEAISRLFSFELALAAPDPAQVAFDRLLGAEVTVHLVLPDGRSRHFSGMCAGLCQGMTAFDLTSFTMEIVPSAWRLTRRVQSRIFQRAGVPEILKRVFQDVPDVEFDLVGEYPELDFCVQYRETDFDFASRLMEEEGISYYFLHEANRHRMVVSDKADFPRLDPDRLVIQEGSDLVDEQRITSWEKRQRLRSGRVTLRDHCFELPSDPLEARASAPEVVQVGRVPHRVGAAGGADALEIYEWPGAYARRFDGVDRYGNRLGAAELDRILPDGRRTAAIRMEQEAAEAIVLHGHGLYRHMAAGRSFKLENLGPNAQRVRSVHDGDYVVTSVGHRCEASLDYRSGSTAGRLYQNSFTCIPADIRYRPPRVTPRPTIAGPQTAVVVKGPADDEIFTDPYGRVKVKFYWDRDGGPNPDSSCWIRVSQPSAGGSFGMIFVPRGGQEVVVHFEDGDPDRPLITGAVYNPSQMPPFELPAGKMISGFRSNTYPGGGGLNEISVNDSGKVERMYIHAQFNKDEVVGDTRTAKVGRDASESIGNNLTETVGADKSTTITGNSTKKVLANETKEVTGNQTGTTTGNQSQTTLSDATETVSGKKTVTVGSDLAITAGSSITLKCGASSLSMNAAGIITLTGTSVTIAGAVNANVAAPLTNVAGGVMLNLVGAITTVQGLVTKVGGMSSASLKGGDVEVGGDAIKVTGATVNVAGTGDVGVDGAKVTVKAKGDAAIQGALVKLN